MRAPSAYWLSNSGVISYFDNNDYIHVLNTLYCCYSWRCPISTNKLVSAPHSRHKAKDGGMDHYSSRESNFAKQSHQKLALNTAFEGNVQRWLSFLQATIIDKNIYKWDTLSSCRYLQCENIDCIENSIVPIIVCIQWQKRTIAIILDHWPWIFYNILHISSLSSEIRKQSSSGSS